MKEEQKQKLEGTVLEALPNTMFRVEILGGQVILATLAGRMRKNFIRILPGDRVLVEMTQYDKERGRIVWRQ